MSFLNNCLCTSQKGKAEHCQTCSTVEKKILILDLKQFQPVFEIILKIVWITDGENFQSCVKYRK